MIMRELRMFGFMLAIAACWPSTAWDLAHFTPGQIRWFDLIGAMMGAFLIGLTQNRRDR